MRTTPGARREKVNVVGSSTFGRYQKISSAKTINMFTSDNWLVNTAGYQRILNFITPETGQGRCVFHSVRGNLLIAVVNASVFSIGPSLIPVFIGTLATASGEVFIDENLNAQICIVDGVNAYIYNYATPGSPPLTVQSGLGTLIPNYVCYHNTFFLFGNANTTSNGAAWYAYVYDSATTIVISPNNTGQFALQTKPDFAVAVVRLPAQSANVLVFGTTVCEVWTQIGGLQNYRKNTTISVDYGCGSVSTIATSDKFVAWLGTNQNNAPVIMVYTGQGFERISTDGIDYQLGTIQFPSQSTGMMYRQDGHLFYQLTFYNPIDNLTLLYDFNTQQFFNLSDNGLNYHPARDYVYYLGKVYFISLNNGALYQSSTDLTTYNENLPQLVNPDPNLNLEIQHIRICDTIRSDDSAQFRPNTFFFTIEQGNDVNVSGLSLLDNFIPLITEDDFNPPDDDIFTEFGTLMVDEASGAGIGQGDLPPPYQPRVDMSISTDGGITWSNTVGRNLHPIGYRQNILNWENLGSCNSLTIKLRFWGTARFVAYDGGVELY